MYGHTVKSPYKGHCGDLELLSSLARVRNSGSLFQPNICTFFAWGLAAVRIIVVSVIARCPQGESWLYLHGENVDKGKFISYGEGGITFWVCGFGGLHALHFTHFNQPLKYATLLHYSHIPNKHKKLHICLVQRQPNIRSLSVLSYRASSLNLVVCRDVTLVVVWVLA